MNKNSVYKEQSSPLVLLVENQERPYDMPFAHYHNAYEIYILESGTRNYIIDDEFFEITNNDVALITPYTLHKTTGGPFKRSLISIRPEYFEKYFSKEASDYLLEAFRYKTISLNTNLFSKLRSLYKELISASEEEKFIYISLLLSLLRNASKTCITNKKILSSKEKQIEEIVKYINSNFLEINSLDDICNNFFITKGHLCRIFKSTLNMSVISYLNNVKVQNACEFLASTKKSITDIGFESGFNSTMYFCKTFKKYLGISPLEYRQKLQRQIF